MDNDLIERGIENKNRNLLRMAYAIVFLGFSLPLIILIIENLNRNGFINPLIQQTFSNVLQLGTIGDWIGGSAAPLLNFAAFLILLVSLNYQRAEIAQARHEYRASLEEMKLQRELIKQQRFETTLFNLIDLHHGLAKSAKNSLDKDLSPFRPHYDNLFDFMLKGIEESYSESKEKESIKDLKPIDFEYDLLIFPVNSLYNGNEHVLGPYVGNVTNILRLIYEESEQDFYLKMFKAQLSNDEKIWLFYHWIFTDNREFHNLCRELVFFNDIDSDRFINRMHPLLFLSKTFDPKVVEYEYKLRKGLLPKTIEPPILNFDLKKTR
ncbi:putative phage abortive infection protein [Paenibacillus sp. 32352]|uniref:putative phage abortive infection protein n=1 Tax=Paenibacillus sp. 32352 TaxID=1969111 RepID=UPI0009AED6E6|nr:putative phage abortive infection protein [Paenibacillus sp. 32352]